MKELLEKIKKQANLIPAEDFDQVFNGALAKMSKSFSKLEKEQYYDCDAATHQIFLKGNPEELIEELRDFSKKWPPSNWKENKTLKINRLRLVKYPPNSYLEHEMYFYLINKNGGENIKCLDMKQASYKLNELDDFIIFDDNEIIINTHDNKGVLLGSYHLRDSSNLVSQLLNEFKLLFDKGQDFEKCYNFNEDIVKDLIENGII